MKSKPFPSSDPCPASSSLLSTLEENSTRYMPNSLLDPSPCTVWHTLLYFILSTHRHVAKDVPNDMYGNIALLLLLLYSFPLYDNIMMYFKIPL